MFKLAIRGMRDRKLRVALTALAVLLGVTMISGTFVFTDTINKAFDQLFSNASKGSDVVIKGKQGFASQFSLPPSLPEATVAKISGLPHVDEAAGQINDSASIVGKNGKLVKVGGAPNFGFSYLAPPFNGFKLASGRPPVGPHEVVIDESTYKKQDFKLGQQIKVATANGTDSFKLVGFGNLGGSSIGAATMAGFDLPTAQRLFNKVGKVDRIDVNAIGDVSTERLIAEIKPVLPKDSEIKSAEAEAKQSSEDITNSLGFLTTALLAFGFIAVFVGAFIIFNTFSITVAQRRREFALLRMLGGARSQILKSVVIEAFSIGLFASLAGLFFGLLTATGINTLFKAAGIDLPTTNLVFAQRTVVVSMLVGVLVTLFSSIVPAIKATRVAPLEALRESQQLTTKRRWKSLVISLLVTALGVLLLLKGLLSKSGNDSANLQSAAGGAVVMVVGIALFSPRIMPLLARAIGWFLEIGNWITTRIARENAQRNPGRTSITAAALMIGLSLVLFVTIFANGLRTSANKSVDQAFRGDFIIRNQDGFTPIPAGVFDAVQRDKQIAVASPLRLDQAKVTTGEGKVTGTQTVSGADSATFNAVYKLDMDDGSQQLVTQLGSSGVLVEKSTADAAGLKTGERVVITTPVGKRVTLTVKGTYKDDFLTGYLISMDLFTQAFKQPSLANVIAKLKPGVSVAAGKAGLEKTLTGYPQAQVSSQKDLKEQIEKNVNMLLQMIYALLSMSVLVSLFGIVNTLTLSIYERTRELGLLRAVGMSRSQTWRMVTFESVITAAIGAVMGLLLGIFFAFVVTRAIGSDGIAFVIPWGEVIALMAVAVIAGIVAAVLPSWRASKIKILEAISYE